MPQTLILMALYVKDQHKVAQFVLGRQLRILVAAPPSPPKNSIIPTVGQIPQMQKRVELMQH